MPAWLAVIVQVPAASRLIERPDGLQMAGVFDVSVTGSPELAVAVTARGDWASVAFGGRGNVMDCAMGAPGVTAFDGADGTLVPTSLVAVTVNVYVVPFVSPVTTTLRAAAPAGVVVLPGLAVTV